VSGPIVALAILAILVVGYMLFNRPELAPPGVGLHSHGEETPDLPWSPPADDSEKQALRKGLLPLGISAVFPPLAEDRGKGARVAGVAMGSPAERAGLRPGDLIKSFSDVRVSSPWSLVGPLEQVKVDEEYKVLIVRANEETELVVSGVRPLPLEERVR